MLQINIATQPIRLEYTINQAKLDLQSPPAMVQKETTPPLLEMRQPPGELMIDSTPCRASIGIKNNTDFMWDNFELGKQAVLKAIARIVDEGNQYAHIESSADAFAEIAANSSFSEASGITLGHIEAPEIHYQANPVQFNLIEGKINLSVEPSPVQGNYSPGGVNFRVTQYPSIQFSTVDVKV